MMFIVDDNYGDIKCYILFDFADILIVWVLLSCISRCYLHF